MLWVHGYTIDSSLWGPLWDRLPGYVHIGIDLPGHGGSAPLTDDETLTTLAHRIGQWAIPAGITHVVGLSIGTTIALQLALDHPRALQTLTLGAPALGGGPVEAEVGTLYVELRALERLFGRGSWIHDRWLSAPPDLFTHARRRPELWPKIEAVVRRHRWDELASFGIARLATQPQALIDVAAVEARLLLMIGSMEMTAFVETARLLEATAHAAETVILPDVGHLCMLEDPDTTATLLLSHWRAR